MHQFLDTVKNYRLISEGERVLVGISGGADSVCLLDLLRVVAPKWRLELFGIHINHGLRDSANRDQEFVQSLCDSWMVKLKVVRVDVSSYARRHRLGIEEASRQLRYRHYRRVAAKLNCNRVALGHNADDNLETVILNLVRGAGLRGLAGIPVRRGIFVRPLIGIPREAIRNYLRAREIGWVEDESNEDLRFRRNFIRQKVVPVLKQLNPAVVETVARSGAIIGAEDVFLDFLALNCLEKVGKRKGDRIVIDIKGFNSYNFILKRRMLKLILPRLDAEAVERVLMLIDGRKTGRYRLKAGVDVEIKGAILAVSIDSRG